MWGKQKNHDKFILSVCQGLCTQTREWLRAWVSAPSISITNHGVQFPNRRKHLTVHSLRRAIQRSYIKRSQAFSRVPVIPALSRLRKQKPNSRQSEQWNIYIYIWGKATEWAEKMLGIWDDFLSSFYFLSLTRSTCTSPFLIMHFSFF